MSRIWTRAPGGQHPLPTDACIRRNVENGDLQRLTVGLCARAPLHATFRARDLGCLQAPLDLSGERLARDSRSIGRTDFPTLPPTSEAIVRPEDRMR